jgi:Fe-S cluster assembly protein SufD
VTTPAIEQTSGYVSLFEEFARPRASNEPGWLQSQRRSAIERFATEGFPTTRQEAWRFTSVAAIARSSFRPMDDAFADVGHHSDAHLPGAISVVFANGRLVQAPSSSSLPEGLRLRSLREALARDPESLQGRLGRLTGESANVFAALNTAFFADGVLMEVLPGAVVKEPVHVVFLSSGTSEHVTPLIAPRVLVVAGRGSESAVVESHVGVAEGGYLSLGVSEIFLEEGARVDHHKLQQESRAAFHVATLAVRQERDSRFADHAVSLGAALARNDIGVALAGEGAECVLDGLFVTDGEQHSDTHTHIDHAQPQCASRELYKGILSERSRGVFHGTILVRPGAQKTDALQVNRNLLLSKEALVNSTPALEIHADDVKCKHGSTTGHLDALALFYLRSRGVGEEAARNLLVHAFAGEVVGRLRLGCFRAHVEAVLRQRLPGEPS